MSSRGRVVRSFGTRRGDIVRRILESCHIGSFQAGVVCRVRRGCGHGGLPLVIVFHCLLLCLTLHVGFEASLPIGVDGLFGKVVGTAAS